MNDDLFSIPQLKIAEQFTQLLTLIKYFSTRRAELQCALTKPCLRKKDASEEWFGNEQDVEVDKPLGLSFGGIPEIGHFIGKVVLGGNADATNVISDRMRIMAINGLGIDSLSAKEVTEKIKAAGAVVKITVRDDPLGYSYYMNSVSVIA